MLETERLILRPFEDSDIEDACAWFGDPAVFRFYTYGPYRSTEETAARLRQYREHFHKYGFGKCAVIEKATATLIGDAGLAVEENTGEIHLGYKLARRHWGKGFATEAANAWVDYGFDDMNLENILAFVHPVNTASLQVLRRLQFTFRTCRQEAGVDWSVYERHRSVERRRRRPSARILVIDQDNRVLLFRFVFKRGALQGQDYWATPGGAVETGETFEDAARRELFEETGISVGDLGRYIAEHNFTLQLDDGEKVLAEERFFVVRTMNQEVSQDHWSPGEREVMAEHKWWSIVELSSTVQKYYPEGLVTILNDIIH